MLLGTGEIVGNNGSMHKYRTAISILYCTLSLFPPACVAVPAGGAAAKPAKSAAPLSLGSFKMPTGKISLGFRRIPFESGMLSVAYPLVGRETVQGELVSIDNADLSALSDDEIDQMLLGDVGTTKKITVIAPNNKVKTHEMVCEPIAAKGLWDFRFDLLKGLDRRELHWNSAFAESSLDLHARAAQYVNVAHAAEAGNETSQQHSTNAYARALTCYEVGDMAGGDSALAVSNKAYVPGQPWRLYQNRRSALAIHTLIAADRREAADALWERLYKIQGPESALDDGAQSMALHYLQQGDAARTSAVLASVTKRPRAFGNLWPAGILLRLGQYSEVKKYYADILEEMLQQNDRNWQNSLILRQALVHMAEAQFGDNEKAAAKESLRQAVEISNKDCSPDLLAALDKMPHNHPHLVDIQNAITAIDTATQFPPSIAAVPNRGVTQILPTALIANAARNNDAAAAKAGLEKLLQQYRYSVRYPLALTELPNLYCHVLTAARRIADRGWFDMSNQALAGLRAESYGKDVTPLVQAFLQAELTYNSLKSGGNPDNALQAFDAISAKACLDADGKGHVPSLAERLRLLAMVYYYAGELDRAQIYIDRAIAAADNKSLALLDAACIAARSKDFEAADRYWSQVREMTPVDRPAFFATTRELCAAYSDNGKDQQIMPILQAAVAVSDDNNANPLGNGRITLRLYLADLLLAQGKSTEAYAIAKDVAAKNMDYLRWSQKLIIARSAEAAGDLTMAANVYATAAQVGEMHGTGDGAAKYLERALLLADKVPGYDRAKLTDICMQLANVLRYPGEGNAERCLQLTERTCKLMPDSDPRKPMTLIGLTYMQSQASAADRLATFIQAAELAEKYKNPEAHRMWLQVAVAAQQAGDMDAYLKYVYKALNASTTLNEPHELIGTSILTLLTLANRKPDALKLLDAAIARSRSVDGPKSNSAQRLLGIGFEYYLGQGQKELALKMLDQALACNMKTGESETQAGKHSHCGGPPPPDAVSFVYKIFALLPDQEKSHKAGWYHKSKMQSDDAFVLTVLKKVLAAQRGALAPDDERLVPALRSLGYFYHRTGKYIDAQKYYDEAFKVESKYQKPKSAAKMLGNGFIANLKKVDRANEAAQYEAD